MINTFYGWTLSFVLLTLGFNFPSEPKSIPIKQESIIIELPKTTSTTTPETKARNWSFKKLESTPTPGFAWGDISWLPQLALRAGWPEETHEKLGEIILRESGGCPNRRGGDMVDKDCNITGVSEWNHRSDTGLLQINGVNYDSSRNKWAIACRVMNICTQDPLLDPLINLQVGYLLYQNSGWSPWDPCAWGPKYANRCKKSNP